MIILETKRILQIQPKAGDIFLNEDEQKFIVKISTTAALFAEPYEGKRKATFFVFTSPTPSQEV